MFRILIFQNTSQGRKNARTCQMMIKGAAGKTLEKNSGTHNVCIRRVFSVVAVCSGSQVR